MIESPAACWIPSVRSPNGVHFSGLVQQKGSGVSREVRWFICRNCGLLESTPDRYFNIVSHRCEWCDHARRWLTAEEVKAVTESSAVAEALRAGKYVNMTDEEGRYVFTEWGSRPSAPKRRGPAPSGT